MTKIPDDIMDAALQCCAGFLTGHREIYVEDVALTIQTERTRALSQLEAGAVKPLEWFEHPGSFPAPEWSAQTPFGFYNIEEISASDSPAYEVRLHAHRLVAVVDGLSEAKAAAQADYSQRILSALASPSPAPEAEPVAKRWLVEQHLPSGSIQWECFEHELHARNVAERYSNRNKTAVTPLYTTPTPAVDADAVIAAERKFKLGDPVHKPSGSWWEGKVVGFYSTEQTPIGYCVQLLRSNGPVQIYPETALALSLPPSADKGE